MILGFLILLVSLFFVFVLTPVKIWQQYAEKEAVQVVITPLGEKNKASYYNQITIDHLEIDGQSYDLADYVQSGTWDESRNTLTWEDKGGHSDSIVLNIPEVERENWYFLPLFTVDWLKYHMTTIRI